MDRQVTQRMGSRRPVALPWLFMLAAFAAPGCAREATTALEQIRASGTLRVVTLNAPTTYYLGTHGAEGLEYTLANQFAQRIGVRLELTTVADRSALRAALAAGTADLAAAQLSFDASWREAGVPSARYGSVRQYWVYRRGRERPASTSDLTGRRIVVVEDSAESAYIGVLAEQPGVKLEWIEIPRASMTDSLDAVANGQADVALVDSNEFAFARPLHPEIAVAFAAARERPLHWIVRRGAEDLRKAVDGFFGAERRTGRLATTLERALPNSQQMRTVTAREFRAHVDERLPQLQRHFEQASVQTGIDWRLLAALGYQESQWNPRAQSANGAQGLMMLMPQTATELGVIQPFNARENILAGARYLVQVREQVPPRIPEPDRSWFAIASYNIGYGHLEDARVITQMRGGNPDRWSDVRGNLPLLSEPAWYGKVKHGYARGWEAQYTVDRVRQFADVLAWRTTERHRDPSATAGAPATSTPETAP
jgi:membrane-bound lytic murein transglycosylase MltF